MRLEELPTSSIYFCTGRRRALAKSMSTFTLRCSNHDDADHAHDVPEALPADARAWKQANTRWSTTGTKPNDECSSMQALYCR